MGRSKYSSEKRQEIMSAFVLAAIDIMKTEGVGEISIRHVSARAGFSSATLYLYFEDLNELISLASVVYLRNYVREISETGAEERTPKETYLYTWDVFVRHALNKPDIYLNLFFGPNSHELDKMVSEYYQLFPEELESVHEPLLGMLESGSLLERNKAVLIPYAAGLELNEEEVNLANSITVAYLRDFLDGVRDKDLSDNDKRALTDEFLDGALFIVHDHR